MMTISFQDRKQKFLCQQEMLRRRYVNENSRMTNRYVTYNL